MLVTLKEGGSMDKARALNVLDSVDSPCISTRCLFLTLWTLRVSPLYVYRHFSRWTSYRRTRLRGNPKSSNFTSRSYTRPRQSPQRVAREPQKLQLYLAFARSTTPIHAKGCASRRKVAILPRVQALDHANPRKGLHSRSMASVPVPRYRKKDRYTEM